MRVAYQLDGEYVISLSKGACSSTRLIVGRVEMPFFLTPDFTGVEYPESVRELVTAARRALIGLVKNASNGLAVNCSLSTSCGTRRFSAVPTVDAEGVITLKIVQRAEYEGALAAMPGGEGWSTVGTECFDGAVYSTIGVFDSMEEYMEARQEAGL